MNIIQENAILCMLIITMISCGKNSSQKEESTIANSKNLAMGIEDFDSFYERFHEDSAFQMSRVQFPIKGGYEDFDTLYTWNLENYELIKFKADQIDTLEYKVSLERKEKQVIEQISCKECGFSFEMEFKLIDDKWFLTYRQENNF